MEKQENSWHSDTNRTVPMTAANTYQFSPKNKYNVQLGKLLVKFQSICPSRIPNAVPVAIVLYSCNMKKLVFHIASKTQFSQLKNLSDTAILSRISHILNA